MMGVVFPLYYTSISMAVAAMAPNVEIAGLMSAFSSLMRRLGPDICSQLWIDFQLCLDLVRWQLSRRSRPK